MFPKIVITMEKHGDVFDIEIKDPSRKKQFVGSAALAEYLSTHFSMSSDETESLLKQINLPDGRCAVFVLPILPENVALL